MSYDVLVIGSGPGGYVAAIRAAQFGLKAAVVEKDLQLGGTCLHVGCVPTKAYLHFADLYENALHSGDVGVIAKEVELDPALMLRRKKEIVNKHAKGVEFLFKKNKVDWIPGYGRLLGGGKVEVEGKEGTKTFEPKHILLATGSEARLLPGLEPDPELILTNVEILELKEIPKSMVIVGAGAVGVEFASVYRSFGTEVTLLEALPRVVPLEDEEVSKELDRAYRKRGIKVHTGAKVDSVTRKDGGVDVVFTDSAGKRNETNAEKVLIAIGRKPNTENVGLDKTSIEVERGFVKTDGWMRTAEKGVYAIGDIVAATPQLAHVASMEGLVAVAHMAGKNPEPMNYLRSPNATYCEPQIGSVGLTEAKAREQGRKVKTSKFGFGANSKASILGAHGGFVKVVADEEFGEILGVHIIGPAATELISEAVVAITSEATVESMMSTIHSHPTLSEAVQEAFNGIYGMTINA